MTRKGNLMNTPINDHIQTVFQSASESLENGDRTPKTALLLCRELAASVALLEVRIESVVGALKENGVDLGTEYAEIVNETFRKLREGDFSDS